MEDVIRILFSQHGVKFHSPATESDVKGLEDWYEAKLPLLLRRLWNEADGLTLKTLDAHILGVLEVTQLAKSYMWFFERGFVPILDMHSSDYLVLAVREPLAYRVIHFSHDGDGCRLLYRNLESCILGLVDAMEQGKLADLYYYDILGDYPPDAKRTTEDQECAHKLLASNGENEEWNLATQLLDETNLNEWAKLLQTDYFVRRDAQKRMEEMSSPAIQELLATDSNQFDEFVEAVVTAAKLAGLKVERKREGLQIGDKWIIVDAFFYRRNIPNAMPRLIAWFEDQLAGRDPHNRPNHFMAD